MGTLLGLGMLGEWIAASIGRTAAKFNRELEARRRSEREGTVVDPVHPTSRDNIDRRMGWDYQEDYTEERQGRTIKRTYTKYDPLTGRAEITTDEVEAPLSIMERLRNFFRRGREGTGGQ